MLQLISENFSKFKDKFTKDELVIDINRNKTYYQPITRERIKILVYWINEHPFAAPKEMVRRWCNNPLTSENDSSQIKALLKLIEDDDDINVILNKHTDNDRNTTKRSITDKHNQSIEINKDKPPSTVVDTKIIASNDYEYLSIVSTVLSILASILAMCLPIPQISR